MIGWIKRALGIGRKAVDPAQVFNEAEYGERIRKQAARRREILGVLNSVEAGGAMFPYHVSDQIDWLNRAIRITQRKRGEAVARKQKRSHYDQRLVVLKTQLLKLEQEERK